MLRCANVEPKLRALIDGELNPGEHARVQAHLDGCAACREQYSRLQSLLSVLHEQEPEDVPAHFSTSLHVRLSRHREERARLAQRKARFSVITRVLAWVAPPRRRWAGGLATALVLGTGAFLLFSQRMGAADVVREAELRWNQIRNYGCEFVSEGVYQGQPRSFTQKQFYRKPGEFRLDTSQDYPLTTFIYRDRVVHYLSGGTWKGQGPLVIVRPRRDGQDALPFPFGVTWNNGGNVSLDQMVRQLSANRDLQLLGKERVGDQDCFHLQFSAVPPGGSDPDQYQLWVDCASFLPRKVRWYRDEQNHIETTAQSLQVNYGVLPSGTFDFQPPKGSVTIHGDVDPHAFALPVLWRVKSASTDDAPLTAQYEAAARARLLPFSVYAPQWIPGSYHLARVRARSGHWLDMHWVRRDADGSLDVLKLVEQDGTMEPGADLRSGEQVTLGTGKHRIVGRLVERSEPYASVFFTWVQGGTRLTLFGADLPRQELLRVAQSLQQARGPEPTSIAIAQHPGLRTGPRAEPSVLPVEPENIPVPETAITGADVSTPAGAEQPPMMPEMSDEDRAHTGARTGSE